jgi:hypothetical protein
VALLVLPTPHANSAPIAFAHSSAQLHASLQFLSNSSIVLEDRAQQCVGAEAAGVRGRNGTHGTGPDFDKPAAVARCQVPAPVAGFRDQPVGEQISTFVFLSQTPPSRWGASSNIFAASRDVHATGAVSWLSSFTETTAPTQFDLYGINPSARAEVTGAPGVAGAMHVAEIPFLHPGEFFRVRVRVALNDIDLRTDITPGETTAFAGLLATFILVELDPVGGNIVHRSEAFTEQVINGHDFALAERVLINEELRLRGRLFSDNDEFLHLYRLDTELIVLARTLVPEPATLALLTFALGLLGFVLARGSRSSRMIRS